VSVLDPKTLGTDTPRTLDGRSYPGRLRQYEQYDDDFLPHVRQRRPVTVNELLATVPDQWRKAMLDSWLSSAEWRGLIERVPEARPWAYVLGPVGRAKARGAQRHAA
jgi:hypothetical protein